LHEIGNAFGASTFPVRCATKTLVEKGILERIHGKGVIVKQDASKHINTNKIGIISSYKGEGFFAPSSSYPSIVAGVQSILSENKNSILFESFGKDEQSFSSDTIHEVANEVDGLIVIGITQLVIDKLLETITNIEKPVIILGYEGIPKEYDSVLFDIEQGIKSMVHFLRGEGHKKLGMMYRKETFASKLTPRVRNMLRAFADALDENSMPYDEDLLFDVESEDLTDFKKLLTSGKSPTALVCSDDYFVDDVYTMISNLDLKIPEDISIVGFGDQDFAKSRS